MKTRNAVVLAIFCALIGQVFIRAFGPEWYPMIVFPDGPYVHWLVSDRLSVPGRKIMVYGSEQSSRPASEQISYGDASRRDSVRITTGTLFPRSPGHHGNMLKSIAEARPTIGDDREERKALRWMRENISDSVSLPHVDSLCVYRTTRDIPLSERPREAPSDERQEKQFCFALGQ